MLKLWCSKPGRLGVVQSDNNNSYLIKVLAAFGFHLPIFSSSPIFSIAILFFNAAALSQTPSTAPSFSLLLYQTLFFNAELRTALFTHSPTISHHRTFVLAVTQ